MLRIIFRRGFGRKFLLIILIIVALYLTHKTIVVYELKKCLTVKQYKLDNKFQELSSKLGLVSNVLFEESHPLENSCKYPILDPNEESIKVYVKHIRSTTCAHVMPELVSLGDDGVLRINQTLSLMELNFTVKCLYRSFAGTLKPGITVLGSYSNFLEFNNETKPIFEDQIEVQCYNGNFTKPSEMTLVYQFAFAQVAPRRNKTFSVNSEKLLSVDMIVLDSTSLNMMRRHMNGTLQYWLKNMGALHLEGYNKVADNSMVNLIPVLVGTRYGDQQKGMPSEYPMDKVLDLDAVPFLWKLYQGKSDTLAYYICGATIFSVKIIIMHFLNF